MIKSYERSKRFDKIIVFKDTTRDVDNLQQLARRLDLSFSETLRRAVRIGAKFLTQVDFPGSSENG
jgi:hypothetical protein